jgi:lantibiotic modifying enzyme
MRSEPLPTPAGAAVTRSTPYLDAAIAIAGELVREALPQADGVTWDTDDLIGDTANHALIRRRCGADLYGGTPGIGWFLGHLAPYDPSGSVATTAVDAMRFALAGGDAAHPSLFSGTLGAALSAVDVATRLGHEDLRHAALAMARRTASRIERSLGNESDLIAGTAGVVVGLLALHRREPDPLFLSACKKACARLLETSTTEWWGRSWPELDGAPALCGLGHGMSGIAWALAEASWATGDARYLDAAGEAFRYERSWFSPERCAWPDLREPDAAAMRDGTWPGWMTAWCHGALGIGAVRLRHYEVMRDTASLAEASAAIHAGRMQAMRAGADLRSGQPTDATLCHGLAGAAELFLLAHEVLQAPDHLRAARRVGDLCLSIHEQTGRWTLGLRGSQWVPGLFVGLAGIGVMLLRLHDPASIGSPMLPGRAVPPAVPPRM